MRKAVRHLSNFSIIAGIALAALGGAVLALAAIAARLALGISGALVLALSVMLIGLGLQARNPKKRAR